MSGHLNGPQRRDRRGGDKHAQSATVFATSFDTPRHAPPFRHAAPSTKKTFFITTSFPRHLRHLRHLRHIGPSGMKPQPNQTPKYIPVGLSAEKPQPVEIRALEQLNGRLVAVRLQQAKGGSAMASYLVAYSADAVSPRLIPR